MITEMAVISGKGGTGKTSIVGSLAYLAENKVMVDCDVDAADLRLILKGKNNSSNEFIGSQKARIIPDNCDNCGICVDYCRFDAIVEKSGAVSDFETQYYIDNLSCEGCGVCSVVCPGEAIIMEDHVSGKWFVNDTKYGPLIHAQLGIAEANSGRLVSLLRKTARDLAAREKHELIIVDGSPGIGCPVIASLTGADYALIVTEPTVSAIHDMERLIELTQHFNIPAGICINKYDINMSLSKNIEKLSRSRKIPVLSRVPYDTDITKAQIEGVPYPEYTGDGAAKDVCRLWQNLKKELKATDNNHKNRREEFINLNKRP